MLALRDPEHLELALVPSGHQVDAEAALANVIGRDQRLGRDQRMKQGRMDCGEHRHARGRGLETGRPGDSLQRRAVKVGIAAIALPTGDRQHEIDASVVRHPGEVQTVRPVCRPALRHFGGRAAR